MIATLPGPVAVIKVPMLSLSQTTQGLIHKGDYHSAPLPQLSAIYVAQRKRPRSPIGVHNHRDAMFYLIFYLLCPKGRAIIYTKWKSTSDNVRHHFTHRLWTLAFANNACK